MANRYWNDLMIEREMTQLFNLFTRKASSRRDDDILTNLTDTHQHQLNCICAWHTWHITNCSRFSSSLSPPETPCSEISCDLQCPPDSVLIKIDSFDDAIKSTTSSDDVAASTIAPGAISEQIGSSTKVKRALGPFKRPEAIQIVPVDLIRRRRDTDDDEPISSNYRIIDEKRVRECCEKKVQCKCDFNRCQEPLCGEHEYKTLIHAGSKTPGSCCPHFSCSSQKPLCYSSNLKHHFAVNETWKEDDCTACVCSKTGESQCTSPLCKPLTCEKRIHIKGECCEVCDTSNSKYCVGDEDCDLHCLHGFEIDQSSGCTICRCAKTTTTPNAPPSKVPDSTPYTIVAPTNTTDATMATVSTTESKSSDIDQRINEMDSTRTAADSWFVYLPILLGICITIAAFVIVVSLVCRHFSHNRGKHRLNHKQNNNLTPLI